MRKDYDILVIGSGPAGGVAARACKDAGLSVAIVECDLPGGVCPLRGCEPKKTLADVSAAMERVRRLAGKGLEGEPRLHWHDLMAFKRSFTEPVPPAVRTSLQRSGIDLIEGRAVFTGPESVAVYSREQEAPLAEYTAGKFCIAVGARPRPLDFPGANFLATSDDFLELETLPKRLLFLGGGFVGLELAHVAAAAGAAVTIATHGDRFLRGFDQMLTEKLLEACQEQGVSLVRNTTPTRLEKTDRGIFLHTEGAHGPGFEADLVVNATGRVPQLQGLGLEAAGVDTERGAIAVNDYMQTSNPRIFAAGDCAAPGKALTPVAVLQAEAAAENMVHGNRRRVVYTGTPAAVFTDPVLAGVGLLKEEIEDQGIEYQSFEGDASGWSEYRRIGRKHAGYRLLFERGTGRILGAHFLGDGAEELAGLLGMAMRQGLTLATLHDAVWPYPSWAYTLRYMLR